MPSNSPRLSYWVLDTLRSSPVPTSTLRDSVIHLFNQNLAVLFG